MDDKQFAEKMIVDYSEKSPTKLDELRALDKKVKTPAIVFVYIFSVLGALILGTGMCLAVNIIGKTTLFMLIGVVVGLVGIAMCIATYPIYKRILEKRKRKYAKEILKM